MDAPRSTWLLPSTLALACWILGANPAAADSILAGTVTDAITHHPVAGANGPNLQIVEPSRAAKPDTGSRGNVGATGGAGRSH